MTKLKKGDIAPEFQGLIAEGKFIKLSELRGKNVVLYFYPKDNTPGCTIEAKNFAELKPKFDEANTEIIGVSKDNLKSHSKFCSYHDLNFTLISDFGSDLCEKYGVFVEKSMFGKKYMGIERSTFLINKDGIIEKIWPSVSVLGHAQAVLDYLKDL